MSLPAPNLDDRRFQDLVDDAKRLVQQRTRVWTDHNVSDPGVTLIEAFAWITDQMLYRLNRVPELQLHQVSGPDRGAPLPADRGTRASDVLAHRAAARRRHHPGRDAGRDRPHRHPAAGRVQHDRGPADHRLLAAERGVDDRTQPGPRPQRCAGHPRRLLLLRQSAQTWRCAARGSERGRARLRRQPALQLPH